MPSETESVPPVIEHPTSADVLEVMTRAVFQAGLSWAQITRHWDAYRRAFAGFDPAIVAAFDETSVQEVLAQPGVLRSPRKVKATIANARALVMLEREFGSFHNYVTSLPNYASLAKDLKRRFLFMGAMNVWYLLFRLGEPVPRFEKWATTIPGEHPRMREMVEAARSVGKSHEY
jgi:3-methyladenine DNA glycosylase Tag